MKTKIVCISDIHGFLPTNLPTGDILLIAGDICPTFDHSLSFQQLWMSTNFDNWLTEQKKKFHSICFVGGNHDFGLEKGLGQDGAWPHYCNYDYPMKSLKGIYYLQDTSVTIDGIKIWGTPHQRRFYDWAFNLDEPQLAEKWELIPKDTDIIMCHGPAYSYGDSVINNGDIENVGSPSMLKKIDEIKPRLYVCGHIHSGYGLKYHGTYPPGFTMMVNASYVNERYKPTNKPIVVEL